MFGVFRSAGLERPFRTRAPTLRQEANATCCHAAPGAPGRARPRDSMTVSIGHGGGAFAPSTICPSPTSLLRLRLGGLHLGGLRGLLGLLVLSGGFENG